MADPDGRRRWFNWRWLVWVAPLALIAFAWHDLHFEKVWEILTGLQAWQLVLLAAFNLFILALFSVRWRLILQALGERVPFRSLIAYRVASFGLSYFTPGPQFGGEPLQVYLLHRRGGAGSMAAAASVTLDKLLELLANFTFLAFGLLVSAQSGVIAGLSPAGFLPAAIGLLTLPALHLALMWAGLRPVSALAGWAAQRLPRPRLQRPRLQRLVAWLEGAETQVGGLLRQKPGQLWLALGFSLSVWALSVVEYWLSVRILGVALSLPQAIAALTAARLAFLLPMPGGLGALEASQVLALEAMGFDPAFGLVVSLLIRARDTSIAAAGLWLGAYLTGSARKGQAEPPAAPESPNPPLAGPASILTEE